MILSALAKPLARSPWPNSQWLVTFSDMPGGHVFERAAVLHDRCARLHRRIDVGDMGQDLIVDLDQLQRRLRGRGVDRGDGGDGVAVIKRLVAGHAVVLHVADEIVLVRRQIGRGQDRLDARQRLRGRGVDRLDPGMGVRARRMRPTSIPGAVDVGAVHRPARDLVHAVGAADPCADLLELALLVFVE